MAQPEPSLAGARAKLGRARLHYEALKNELAPVPGLTPCPVTVEKQREGLEYLFRVRDPQHIDDRWLHTLGDCLFNLRAALDHLVYQLHVRRFRRTLTEEEARRSSFPIHLKPPRARDKPWKDIKSLSQRQQTAIKHLQPYNRRKDQLRTVRLWLGAVDRLHNIDEHRHLHVAWHAIGAVRTPGLYPGLGFKRWTDTTVALEQGTVVERWTFEKAPPEVEMHPGMFQRVMLAEPYGPNSIGELPWILDGLVAGTETVLNRFAKYFPSDT